MPSSTFSSETQRTPAGTRLSRATVALLGCAVLLFLLVEGAARFGLQRVSRIHRRVLDETAAARNLTQPADGSRTTVLLAGNSLLLEGVDMNLLNAGLQSQYEVQRYVVEQTYYLDWLYALKRLFRQGTRPGMVMLCLNAPQMVLHLIRGDFSARMLFDVQDIWPVVRDTGADLTTASGYYLAHYSEFYAQRTELRGVLMVKLAPQVANLFHDATNKGSPIPPDDQVVPVMAARLRQMSELCASYGAKFIFLVPPGLQTGDIAISRAGEQTGIRVLRPIPSGSLPIDYFRDGFHLNAKGATVFTTAIVNEMR